jgi:hypothetical protein
MTPTRSLALLLLLVACDKPSAFGEANSLILVGDEALWPQVESETYEHLERTVFTTREENTFNVTYVAPDGSELDELLMWKQVLVFGVPGDPLIEAVAAEADASPEVGTVLQAGDVWARGQVATAIVLEPGHEVDSWRAALPGLAAMLDNQYRDYALSRMFASGVDTALSQAVTDRYGIELVAPQIYHGRIGDDGIIRLRNDNPRPSERIRSVLVERVEADGGALDPERIFAWRAGIDSVMYNVPQGIERVPVEPRTFDLAGAEALEVRGMWRDEGTFPAAGPFVARAVRCPDAVWYFDAWLYSPNPRASKYEFLLQLEEILDSFRCTTS